jgi:hypothetical protein
VLADAAVLLFPLLVGLPLVLLLQIADSWIESLGLSFLLGVAATTILLTLLGAVGMPYDSPVLLALFGLWIIVFGWLSRARIRPALAHLGVGRMHWIGWVLLGLAAVNVGTGAAYAYHIPIAVNDVVVHWWPKAVLLTVTRSLTAVGHAGVTGNPPHSVFPDYPPGWPLHLFVVRAFSGHAMAAKLLPALYLMSMLGVVFGYLGRRAGMIAAAATVWVISSIPYIWFPYGLYDLMSEIPFMALAVASTIMLAVFLESRRRSQLVALLLLAAGIVLLRPEGLEHALIIVGVLGVASWLGGRDWRPAAIGLGAVLLTYLGWQGYVRLVLKGPATFQPVAGRLIGALSPDAVGALLRYGAHELLNPFIFGPTAIATVCLLVGWQSRRHYLLFVAVFLLDVAAMSLIYLVLPTTDISTALSWWLITGFKRMLLHFVPLLFIAAALAIAEPLRAAWRSRRQWTTAPAGPGGGEVAGRTMVPAAVLLLTVAGILATAWVTVRLTGPRDIDLAQVIPNGVVNLESIGYVRIPTSGAGSSDAMRFQPAGPGSVLLLFDLHNLGQAGPPPNETIFGRFTRLNSTVGLPQGAGPSERFVIRADGRLLAQSPVLGPGDAPVALIASIPAQAQILQLEVDPTGPTTVQAIWSSPGLHRDSAWLPVVILLAAAAILALVMAFLALGVRRGLAQRVQPLGPGFIAAVLLVAGLVQQLDVLTNSAFPLWYAGARRVFRVLHGI